MAAWPVSRIPSGTPSAPGASTGAGGAEGFDIDPDPVAWGVELRRAFDQLTINFGEPGKQAAWRALVAQVAASPDASERPAVELAPFARLAATVARWEPALAELRMRRHIVRSAKAHVRLVFGADAEGLAYDE